MQVTVACSSYKFYLTAESGRAWRSTLFAVVSIVMLCCQALSETLACCVTYPGFISAIKSWCGFRMSNKSCIRIFALFLASVTCVAIFGNQVNGQRRFGFRSCPNGCVCLITTVRCTHHRLSTIPRIPPDTRTLDLRYNRIRNIPPSTFRGLRNLYSLLLNNNYIRTISEESFQGLTSLKYLYLYKNRIHTIHKRALKGLVSLEQLYLHDNELETIHPTTFNNLPKLERLFLQGNRLTILPSVMFNNLNSLRRLRLDSNRLQCDCHLAWFSRYLRETSNNLHATATCYRPRSLAGRAISSVEEDVFECSEGLTSVPIIVLQPEDVEARQGHSVQLSCRASGSPEPDISWTHNGEDIDQGGRFRVLSDGTLLIQVPQQSDTGDYVCVATNAAGATRSDAATFSYVGSTGPPAFLVTPSDYEVMLNDRVTFQCKAAGNPEPVTRWYRNKERLPTLPNYVVMRDTLHIRQAGLNDNGTFTCVVANSEGSINSSASLLVRSTPTFTQSPTDQTAVQGRRVIIDCHAQGVPQPEITWLKNGEALIRDQRYLVMSSGSLLIRAVNTADEGTYTCKAQSTSGSRSANAHLTVIVPPHFTVRPQNQRVRQGLTVDFQCQVAGRPQPHIVWTVNGRAIPDDPRYNLLPSGTLRLLRAQPTDAGVYRCEAANSVGAQAAQVTLTVIPRTPLVFARSPVDQEVNSGSNVHIACQVTGGGAGENLRTEIFWSKDGVRIIPAGRRIFVTAAPSSVLTIMGAGKDDSGRYECRAQSGNDVIAASMTLTVNVQLTEDEIVRGLSGILPSHCLRHGCTDDENHHENSEEETLDILRQYFTAPESFRSKRQAEAPNVVSLSEFQHAVRAATLEVNRGINSTIQHFNNRQNRQSAGDLLTLMRFPSSQEGVDLTRAAEVFDVSLRIIECCVRRGMRLKKFTLQTQPPASTTPEFDTAIATRSQSNPREADDVMSMISTEVVELVANLSGCSQHRVVPDCSANICFHRKYRTSDGTCNNLQRPMWGASLTPFHRLLQPIYENGFNAPVGWDSEKLYNNHSLPSPRSVSVGVLMSAGSRPPRHDPDFTHMVMQWGQFLDHDMDFTTMAPSIQRFSDGQACRDSCEREGPCFPIAVDANDSRHGRFHHHSQSASSRRGHGRHGSPGCMEFTRSSAVCGSGITSVFFSAVSRREQINQITSYLDASNVYGSTDEDTRNLRDLSNQKGFLKQGQPLEVGQKPLLPYNVFSDLQSGRNLIRPVAPIECRRGDGETPQQRSVPCFLAGDLRVNEQVSLTCMHTVWMREHNRIARYLKKVNSHWDGDTIFHETRKIVGAQMQHITFSHWLPKLLGPFTDLIGPYRSYDPNTPSSVVNVFATAAYRFGHTMINPIMFRLNETWHETRHGNLMLHQAFFAPFRIVHEGGIDPLIRGLIAKPMKARDTDSTMNEELIERLFAMAEEVALDLGALNVQRGRDHGLPFYTDWRQFCNLSRAETFDDLANEIKNSEVRNKLKELYKVPENIDPFVGMIVEDIVPGSRLGPTLGCLLSEQFKRTRDGDRFWYENPGIFSPIQTAAIKQTSLARVICDNTDTIKHVPRDVFRNQPTSDFVSCDEIPSIDLTAWIDCCQDCSESGSFETLSGHVRSRARAKRSIEAGEQHTDRHTYNRKATLEKPFEPVFNRTMPETTTKQARKHHTHHSRKATSVKKNPAIASEDTFNQLLTIVDSLQKRVNQLQSEVRRLEDKLNDGD